MSEDPPEPMPHGMVVPPLYRLFVSPDGDWYVAAKYTPAMRKPAVLFQGHAKEQALEAILKDMKVFIPQEERKMDSGTYVPKRKDF